jgi:nicotinate phosphoribosyltransferase
MRGGRRLAPSPSLDEIRARTKRELERLPDGLRRLEPSATYPVKIADDLIKLADEVDDRMRRR